MKNESSTWQLKSADWRSDVSAPLCERLQSRPLLHRTFKKGDYIYMSDEPSDAVYFVMAGKVKVGAYSPDGKEVTKGILTPGDLFGEMALVGEQQRRDFALALQGSELCKLQCEEMRTILREDATFCHQFTQLLGHRLARMEQRLEALVFKDSRTRVIEYLRALAAEKGRQVGFEIEVRGMLTHQEMANLTATSRQTVTTVLNELRRDNVITFNRRRLLIRDIDKLH